MQATQEELKHLDRLQKRSDFLAVGARNQKWVSKGFILLAAPNDLGVRRFGITATKKLEKTAVGRNRMKRRLRAVACDILPKYGKDGVDYVLIARGEAATRDYDDMKRDLIWCLGKLGYAHS